MDIQTAALVYCLLIAAAFLGIWLYYDKRDHARFEGERRRTTFRCVRCEQLYVARGSVDFCACPRCAHENARLKF